MHTSRPVPLGARKNHDEPDAFRPCAAKFRSRGLPVAHAVVVGLVTAFPAAAWLTLVIMPVAIADSRRAARTPRLMMRRKLHSLVPGRSRRPRFLLFLAAEGLAPSSR